MSNIALSWLPQQSRSELVFNLPKNETANQVLRGWVQDAGINKKITFHCSRHTAATLLLSLDVNLKTVSEILGHTKIKTTEVYAKVMAKSKREAINKQDKLFG